MTRTITLAPVRKSVRVSVAPARAFEVFTAGIARWWPASHNLLKAPYKATIIEPRAGGRWYQIAIDGSECDNGKVRVWEPPSRLVLVWQIDPQWQYDPGLDTEVEVNFIADGTGTKVELEHRHIERMGEGAQAAHAAVGAPNGWTAILEEYRKHAEGA
ncbi:MAG TPA: SRPBCC family protein [Rhizomicrobium sp.]|nr:SRPBCC family protein [Rhizomicrobium sp.]